MSNLELNGTITAIAEVQEGTAKSSGKAWKKSGLVVETKGDFPKKVFFTVFGEEKVENLLKFNKVGQDVNVSFNAESREYQGRYFTDLQAWRIVTNKEDSGTPTSGSNNGGFHKASEVDNDLPF